MKISGQNHQNIHIVTYLICVIQVYGVSLTITQYPQYPTVSTTATLTCHIPSFTAGAEWFRNGVRLLVTCLPGSNGCLPPSLPGYQFSADATTMNVTVLSLNIILDDTTWTCTHNTDIGYINLKVYNPVGSVQVKNGTNVIVIESQSAVLVCETDSCRPSAAVYWMKNDINITDSYTSGLVNERRVSIGTLNYTGQKGDNGSLLTCGAFNGLGSVKTSAKLIITIYYPPSIEGLNSSYKVIENQPLNVTCVATSNPPSDSITWSPRGEGSVNSTLYFRSVSRNKSGNYSCTAQNTMKPTAGTQQIGTNTSQITVDVLYPPSIQGREDPYKVIENQLLNVTCEVNSNPPADQISWSPKGESSVPSLLYFQSVSRNISGNYSCTAQNTMIPTVGIQQDGKITSQIQLDVLYAPSIEGLNSSYKVIENQPLNVTCLATSNPPANQIHWSPKGEGSVSSILYFSSISRNKSGIYNCTARNTMTPTAGTQQIGTNTSQIQVDVLYGARISNLSAHGENTINENSPAIFKCLVDSNPPSTITWMKEGSSDVLKTESGVVQSNYTIKSAECLDMGNYTCTADNGVMTTAKGSLELFVRCHPRTDFRFGLKTKIYKKHHEKAILRYTVIAYPPPTFTWIFLGNGSETRALPVSASQQDNGQQSELKITNLDITDFGNYFVIANNSLVPLAMAVYEIIQADVPEVPSDVTIIEITQTSVKVQWMAGYNGGPQQTFHIVASAGISNHNATAVDPGYRQNGTAVLNGLLPGTKYSIYVVAINKIGWSNITQAINITTLKVPDETSSSSPCPIAAVAGGVAGAIVAVILLEGISILIWRRYQQKKIVKEQMYENATHVDGRSNTVYEGLSNTTGETAYDTLGASNGTCVEKDSLMYVNLKLKQLTNKNGEPNIGRQNGEPKIGRQNHQTEAAQTVDGQVGETL